MKCYKMKSNGIKFHNGDKIYTFHFTSKYSGTNITKKYAITTCCFKRSSKAYSCIQQQTRIFGMKVDYQKKL